MRSRLPLAVTAAACVVMFGSIAFVFGLVVISMFTGGIDFPGEPEIADASALVRVAAAGR